MAASFLEDGLKPTRYRCASESLPRRFRWSVTPTVRGQRLVAGLRRVLTGVTGMVRWARLVIVGSDGTRREVLLTGEGLPDLAVVAGLARFQLMARRAGSQVRLEDVSAGLGELLDLAGLRDEVRGQASPLCPPGALPREAGGQAEGPEQAFGVQE